MDCSLLADNRMSTVVGVPKLWNADASLDTGYFCILTERDYLTDISYHWVSKQAF